MFRLFVISYIFTFLANNLKIINRKVNYVPFLLNHALNPELCAMTQLQIMCVVCQPTAHKDLIVKGHS